MFQMSDYYKDFRTTSNEFGEPVLRRRSTDTPRRRAEDLPQPLDYPVRELVAEFVNPTPRAEMPRQSFLRKLLGRTAG